MLCRDVDAYIYKVVVRRNFRYVTYTIEPISTVVSKMVNVSVHCTCSASLNS